MWQSETQQTTKICWCGNCSATRSRNAWLPALQSPIQLWGCLCCAETSSPGPWLSRGVLSHRIAVYSPAPCLAIHFCGAGRRNWLCCGVTPCSHVGQVHGIRTPLKQCWRRVRCARMEQPIPVSQHRFNLPLMHKHQMFVQLTCKHTAHCAAPAQSLHVPHPPAWHWNTAMTRAHQPMWGSGAGVGSGAGEGGRMQHGNVMLYGPSGESTGSRAWGSPPAHRTSSSPAASS